MLLILAIIEKGTALFLISTMGAGTRLSKAFRIIGQEGGREHTFLSMKITMKYFKLPEYQVVAISCMISF